MILVLAGERFVDGILVRQTPGGGASGLITSSWKGVSTQVDKSSLLHPPRRTRRNREHSGRLSPLGVGD
jgi:hypothetical protein